MLNGCGAERESTKAFQKTQTTQASTPPQELLLLPEIFTTINLNFTEGQNVNPFATSV